MCLVVSVVTLAAVVFDLIFARASNNSHSPKITPHHSLVSTEDCHTLEITSTTLLLSRTRPYPMAHRSKRKFDSYQEGNPTSPAAMAQINIPRASVNTTNYYDDRYVAIVPTIELQRLYNNWRQLEEQELLAAHVEEQAQLAAAGSSHGGGQNPEFLRPPSLSATIMSRSPSSASTSNSVTGGMNDMGLSEDKPTKRKQGRQGPLDACGKAKAALVRKLNACPNCRLRKVKVCGSLCPQSCPQSCPLR